MKKLVFFIGGLISLNASAQILWGAGSSIPADDNAGRFATAFNSPGGWTTVGVSSSTALWTRTMNGLSQGAYATGLPAIGSPSQSDGAALYDSDYLDNNGVPGAFGTGTCASPHKGQLVSPTFDLTGYTGVTLQAKLFLQYRNFQINELSVGFSNDNGATWTDVSIQQGVGVNQMFDAAFVTVPLSGVTSPSNLTQCQVRLTFDGDYYFAMIDDISIEVFTATQDIAIAAPASQYNYKTSASPAPYKTMPLQIAKTYAPYNYAALITNLGNTDIPLSSSPMLRYELQQNVSGTWTSVLSSNLPIGNAIVTNDTIEMYGDITSLMQAAFNTNGAGDYRFTYAVSQSLTDANSANDSAYHYFTITPDFSWYSASPLLADGGPAYTGSFFPAASTGNVIQELEWGGLYYFPDTTGIAIDSIKYRMKVPANFNMANTSVSTIVNLYEWVDVNADQLPDPSSEFQLRSLVVDNLAIDSADLNTYILRKVKMVDLNTANPVTLQYDLPYPLKYGSNSDGLYYVSVSQSASMGLVELGGNVNCVYPAVNQMPYEWSNNFSTHAGNPIRVVDGAPGNTGSETWYSGVAGPYVAPSIALSIVDYSNLWLTLGVSENNAEGMLSVFPNPTTNTIHVNVNYKTPSSSVRYILTDANGRVLNMETHKNIQNEVYSLDVTKLSSGTYFMHVKSDNGNITKTFIKQ